MKRRADGGLAAQAKRRKGNREESDVVCTLAQGNVYTPLLFTERRKIRLTSSNAKGRCWVTQLSKHSLGSGIGAERMIL